MEQRNKKRSKKSIIRKELQPISTMHEDTEVEDEVYSPSDTPDYIVRYDKDRSRLCLYSSTDDTGEVLYYSDISNYEFYSNPQHWVDILYDEYLDQGSL